MSATPKISVIMGVYNSKKKELLRASVRSVLAQTFRDFEFIICNDRSTDGEIGEMLEELASSDKRIVLIENSRNLGLAATLNHCLSVARGEYVARQDDDDISLPDRFEKQIEFLESNARYCLVGCDLFLFDDEGIWGMRRHGRFPDRKNFLYGTPFPHPATIVRADVLKGAGGYIVSPLTRRTEDYELYMRLYSLGYRGANLPEPLYEYYENDLNYKQQKFAYRVDEFRLRAKWFGKLKLYPKGLIYLFKPLLSGLVPLGMRRKRKRRIYSEELAKYREEQAAAQSAKNQ